MLIEFAMTCSDLIGAALLAAAEQVEYRHDTRPVLLVKGLARQTTFLQQPTALLLKLMFHAQLQS